MLKLRQTEETNNEQTLILQASCEQLKDQNNQLTNDLWYIKKNKLEFLVLILKIVLFRMSNRKILELEATLKDTTSLAENTTEITDLKKSLNRAMVRNEEESTRTKSQIDELQKRLDNAGRKRNRNLHILLFFFNVYLEKRLNEKDTIITKKTEEINSMEERYVQYLEKAKMVLRQMDPRNSNSIGHQEIQGLKKQLDEKERKIKDLEVNCFFLIFFIYNILHLNSIERI